MHMLSQQGHSEQFTHLLTEEPDQDTGGPIYPGQGIRLPPARKPIVDTRKNKENGKSRSGNIPGRSLAAFRCFFGYPLIEAKCRHQTENPSQNNRHKQFNTNRGEHLRPDQKLARVLREIQRHN